MPIQASSYTPRFPLPDIIQRGRDVVLECPVYSGVSLSEPDSGTCTVYDSSSGTVATGAVVVASDVATFSLPGATTGALELSAGWRVEWVLTMGDGAVYTFRNPAYLVYRELYPAMSDQDLTEGRYYDLSRYLPSGVGTFSEWRYAAWYEIQRRLMQDQRFPWLIMEPSALVDCHRELTLSNFFRAVGMTQRQSDRDWLGLARDHREAFERAWRSLTFDYDSNETGNAPERRAARPTLVLGAVGVDYRY
jgi:hypothetical protein